MSKIKRNKELFDLWKKGTKVAVLADMFEITPQTTRAIIQRQQKPKKDTLCVYPNLRKWMIDNELTITTLSIKIQEQCQMSVMYETLRRVLLGYGCTKFTIEALIKVTGMKYNELFYREVNMSTVTPSKIEISAFWEQQLAQEQKRNEDRERAYSLWKMGVSVKTIAKDLGLTINQVYYAINNHNHPVQSKRTKCIYPNMYGWLMANNLNYEKLAEMTQISANTLSRLLQGENCTKYVIDELIKVTGLKYEELFYREDV